MILNQALRYASIFAVATLLATSLGTHTLRAQTTGTPSAEADAKAAAAKPAATKPQAPAQAGSPQGYRPDPVSNY